MLKKSRQEFCMDLAKCIYDELDINVHVFIYREGYLNVEIPFDVPGSILTMYVEKIKSYLDSVFGISTFVRDWYEKVEGRKDYDQVRMLLFLMCEELKDSVETILLLKGY